MLYPPGTRTNGKVEMLRGGLNGQSGAGKKTGTKLTIRPLKIQPKLPADFEETTWRKLEAAVEAIQKQAPVQTSLEELFRAVEDLCALRKQDTLLSKLTASWERVVDDRLKQLTECATDEPRVFLSRVAAMWESHCQQARLVRDVFLTLDRSLVAAGGSSASLFDRVLAMVGAGLRQEGALRERLIAGIEAELGRDREGTLGDRRLVRALTKMLSQLGLYVEEVERRVLSQARGYYRSLGMREMGEGRDVGAYLEMAEGRLGEEEGRGADCLEPSSRKPLVRAVEEELLRSHAGGIVSGGLSGMLDAGKDGDVGRMYGLLARVGELARMRDAWGAHVRARGEAVVREEARDKEMVQRLVELRGSLLACLRGPLRGDDAFARSLKEGLEGAVNVRPNRTAELVAKYLDGLLRGGGKGATDEDVEKCMEEALALFRLIQGKDVFEAFYKKDLARRLLTGRSASEDAERRMLALLKEECGAQFTTKLEGMFKDMDLSRELIALAKKAPEFNRAAPKGVDVSVSVLTSGHWPSYPPVEVALPGELVRAQEAFQEFYLSKHSGRSLAWVPSQGTCTIKVQFNRGAKELVVSQLQAVVLLAFEGTDRLSFADLREQTGMQAAELKRALMSLAIANDVLKKEPESKDVSESDAFVFNGDFKHKLYRVRLREMLPKEVQEESERVNVQVAVDRQYQIDAAVVRIMKARKALSHKLLISELIQHLQFAVQPPDLKKRIESLIEREFLERDKDDKTVYRYLA